MAGQAKENLSGGRLKYMFVYLQIRIFKCSFLLAGIPDPAKGKDGKAKARLG